MMSQFDAHAAAAALPDQPDDSLSRLWNARFQSLALCMISLRQIAEVDSASATREVYMWGINDAVTFASRYVGPTKNSQYDVVMRSNTDLKDVFTTGFADLKKVQALAGQFLPPAHTMRGWRDDLIRRKNERMKYFVDHANNGQGRPFETTPHDLSTSGWGHEYLMPFALLRLGFVVAQIWFSALKAADYEISTRYYMQNADPSERSTIALLEEARAWTNHAVSLAREQIAHATSLLQKWDKIVHENRQNDV